MKKHLMNIAVEKRVDIMLIASYNERIFLSLAAQFKILRNKLQFPQEKNTHNVTESR
jgi:hypothetical protein